MSPISLPLFLQTRVISIQPPTKRLLKSERLYTFSFLHRIPLSKTKEKNMAKSKIDLAMLFILLQLRKGSAEPTFNGLEEVPDGFNQS